jgi:hypothetical protein
MNTTAHQKKECKEERKGWGKTVFSQSNEFLLLALSLCVCEGSKMAALIEESLPGSPRFLLAKVFGGMVRLQEGRTELAKADFDPPAEGRAALRACLKSGGGPPGLP